jgi:outer membrane biogenesis lipoprotein LolB
MKRKAFASVAALILLAACGNREPGRWIIVPATSTPYAGEPDNRRLYSAWRLDTQTGALEFCEYDSASQLPESLACTKPVTAPAP